MDNCPAIAECMTSNFPLTSNQEAKPIRWGLNWRPEFPRSGCTNQIGVYVKIYAFPLGSELPMFDSGRGLAYICLFH